MGFPVGEALGRRLACRDRTSGLPRDDPRRNLGRRGRRRRRGKTRSGIARRSTEGGGRALRRGCGDDHSRRARCVAVGGDVRTAGPPEENPCAGGQQDDAEQHAGKDNRRATALPGNGRCRAARGRVDLLQHAGDRLRASPCGRKSLRRSAECHSTGCHRGGRTRGEHSLERGPGNSGPRGRALERLLTGCRDQEGSVPAGSRAGREHRGGDRWSGEHRRTAQHGGQRAGRLERRWIPVLGRGRGHPGKPWIECRQQHDARPRCAQRRGLWRTLHDHHRKRDDISRALRLCGPVRLTDEEGIGDHPQRIDIRGSLELRPRPELLRCHVERRPQTACRARGRGVLGDELGHAEIEDLHAGRAVLARCQEQVLGLEIAVDDRGRVGLVERESDLLDVSEHLGGREAAQPREPLTEILPVEELHHDEGDLGGLVDPGVRDIDDVLALDLSGDVGLALEALAHLVALEQVRVHHLERAPPRCLGVDDLVDSTHAAGREAADHAVAAGENRSLSQWRRHESRLARRWGGVKRCLEWRWEFFASGHGRHVVNRTLTLL